MGTGRLIGINRWEWLEQVWNERCLGQAEGTGGGRMDLGAVACFLRSWRALGTDGNEGDCQAQQLHRNVAG